MKLRMGQIALALVVIMALSAPSARADWLSDFINWLNGLGWNGGGGGSPTAPEWAPSTHALLPSVGWALGFAGGAAALVAIRRRTAKK